MEKHFTTRISIPEIYRPKTAKPWLPYCARQKKRPQHGGQAEAALDRARSRRRAQRLFQGPKARQGRLPSGQLLGAWPGEVQHTPQWPSFKLRVAYFGQYPKGGTGLF